jgi:hypothetical protein
VIRVAVLALALAACGTAAAPAGGPGGGLYGLVTRGPTQPVCQVGKPCSAPAPRLTLTFLRNGSTYRVTTNATGHYSIALAPGYYAVASTARTPGGGVRPAHVRVVRGPFAHQNFFVDTGIR